MMLYSHDSRCGWIENLEDIFVLSSLRLKYQLTTRLSQERVVCGHISSLCCVYVFLFVSLCQIPVSDRAIIEWYDYFPNSSKCN